MRIRRASLIFENVLSKNGKCVYKELDKQFIELRDSVIKNDLYQTGAIFYKANINDNIECEIEYEIYIPVNKKLRINNNTDYKFYEKFFIEDGLTLRDEGFEDSINDTKTSLIECAKENGLELENDFFYIYVDIFGENIIDVFAPIG
ncbi:DUF5085 domain-containing protein [Paraclostridium bifermentans]|uniref:DUF5085 domain-containing protein n=1 Tax=Paraclostridium bifermentans TaxID=1490 RepID=UPI00189F6A4F|nr:DUF5085 domain-containing protein [Paraclostridium bifermentans]